MTKPLTASASVIRLGVNIDHVATLRQARYSEWPDPIEAAWICEKAGATSIVCHLREDRRHIQDRDVWQLQESLHTRLNLEMSIARDIIDVALKVRPAQVTWVPERRQELTTEGGLDVVKLRRRLSRIVKEFHERNIAVSLFVDPLTDQLKAARDIGVSIVELHTGCYAEAKTARARTRALGAIQHSATFGKALGLSIAAGHGLDYENVPGVAAIEEIEELNIGYSIVTQALFVGLEQAVGHMVQRMGEGRKALLASSDTQPTTSDYSNSQRRFRGQKRIVHA